MMKSIAFAFLIGAFLVGCGETKQDAKAPPPGATNQTTLSAKPAGGGKGVSPADLKLPPGMSPDGTNNVGSKVKDK